MSRGGGASSCGDAAGGALRGTGAEIAAVAPTGAGDAGAAAFARAVFAFAFAFAWAVRGAAGGFGFAARSPDRAPFALLAAELAFVFFTTLGFAT